MNMVGYPLDGSEALVTTPGRVELVPGGSVGKTGVPAVGLNSGPPLDGCRITDSLTKTRNNEELLEGA